MNLTDLCTENEIFKDVPLYKGFIAVSNKGRVYSHPRKFKKFCGLLNKNKTFCYKGKLLKQHMSNGYLKVRFGIKGKKYNELVSRLILMTFYRMPFKNEFACHNDSNPENNNIKNLRWDNQKGNMKDRKTRGLYKQGSEHFNSKIPIEIIDELQTKKITPIQASKKYGFRYSHLWRISKGIAWKERFIINNQR